MKPGRTYPVFGPEKSLPPNYRRTVERLSFADLCGELEAGRGEQGYLREVSAEIDRRLLPKERL